MESVITVCTGHRCAALLEQSVEDALPALRSSVRTSEHAVLVSTGCLGACAQAPVVALIERRHEHGRIELRGATWLGPVGPPALHALCRWVAEDGTEPLPPALAGAEFDPAPS